MQKLDWANHSVVAEIERHLEVAAPKPVLVIATEGALERYRGALHQLAGRIELSNPALAIDVAPYGVVVALAETTQAARQLYSNLAAAKNTGVAVVICVPERRIARAPANGDQGVLHAPAMYWLAGIYASTLPRGDYVEFGVFDGNTLAMAFHNLKATCTRFHAFDSFQGIGGTIDAERTHFGDGQYYANVETLHYNMRFAGAESERITATAGFFEETLRDRTPQSYGIESASVVHIDTDVYAPALLALQFITPVLPQGALLLFDDYDQLAASNDKGERRAVREWLAANPRIELEEYRRYTAFSRAFIVHRS
jgi:hypothetical protein